jgi:hypothetical protein
LFEECQLGDLFDFSKKGVVEIEPTLSDGSIPDGILSFNETVICFENKVEESHQFSQLSNYYQQLSKERKDCVIILLVAADQDIQSETQIKEVIFKAVPENTPFGIFSWQRMQLACRNLLEEISKTGENEKDLLLISELANLLEEMDMEPYTGLNAEELKGLVKGLEQLSLLENFLRENIPKVMPELENYARTTDAYGSFTKTLLGFAFKNATGKTPGRTTTLLFLKLLENEECLEIGLQSYSKSDLFRFRRALSIEELVEETSSLRGYSIRYDEDGQRKISPKALMKKTSEGSLTKQGFFKDEIRISRCISFQQLQDVYGLNSSEFPNHIFQELRKLKGLVIIWDKALQKGSRVTKRRKPSKE